MRTVNALKARSSLCCRSSDGPRGRPGSRHPSERGRHPKDARTAGASPWRPMASTTREADNRFSNTPSIAIIAPIAINYGRNATSSARATDSSGVARPDTDPAKRSAPTDRSLRPRRERKALPYRQLTRWHAGWMCAAPSLLAECRNTRIAGIGDEHQRGRIEEAVEAELPVLPLATVLPVDQASAVDN